MNVNQNREGCFDQSFPDSERHHYRFSDVTVNNYIRQRRSWAYQSE